MLLQRAFRLSVLRLIILCCVYVLHLYHLQVDIQVVFMSWLW